MGPTTPVPPRTFGRISRAERGLIIMAKLEIAARDLFRGIPRHSYLDKMVPEAKRLLEEGEYIMKYETLPLNLLFKLM